MKHIKGLKRFIRLRKRYFVENVLKSNKNMSSRREVLSYLKESFHYGIANGFIREADGKYLIKALNYMKYQSETCGYQET